MTRFCRHLERYIGLYLLTKGKHTTKPRTMPAAMNLQPLRTGAAAGLTKHLDRKGRIEDHIDQERSHLNRQLYLDQEQMNLILNPPTHQPGPDGKRGRKIRKDAVHACTMIQTLPKELDKDDPEDVRIWAKSSLEWLRNECPGKLAKAVLHMDESRPHIHAFIRPVDERGHLSYKKYFSGSDKLRKLHQSHEASLNWMGVVSNTDDVKKMLAPGYTRGIHGWRVGRAAMQAVESVRDYEDRVTERAQQQPKRIQPPGLLQNRKQYWDQLNERVGQLWEQLRDTLQRLWKIERELKAVRKQRDKNAQDRDQLGKMLLERTPEKMRITVARVIKAAGIQCNPIQSLINAHDSAIARERRAREREQDRGWGL